MFAILARALSVRAEAETIFPNSPWLPERLLRGALYRAQAPAPCARRQSLAWGGSSGVLTLIEGLRQSETGRLLRVLLWAEEDGERFVLIF